MLARNNAAPKHVVFHTNRHILNIDLYFNHTGHFDLFHLSAPQVFVEQFVIDLDIELLRVMAYSFRHKDSTNSFRD